MLINIDILLVQYMPGCMDNYLKRCRICTSFRLLALGFGAAFPGFKHVVLLGEVVEDDVRDVRLLAQETDRRS